MTNPFKNLFTRNAPAGGNNPMMTPYIQQLRSIMGGFFGASEAGPLVTPETALTLSAVLCAVNVIANGIASLPVHVVKGYDKQTSHPLYSLLHDAPNPLMTAFTFRQCMQVNLLLWGVGYAVIERDELGRPVALWPVPAKQMRPQIGKAGEPEYVDVTHDRLLTADQVLHLVAFTLDGFNAVSPIAYAKNTVGISLSLDSFAGTFFSNGANAGGILELPPMSPDAFKAYVAEFRKQYQGLDNAHKTVAVPGGKFHSTSTSPNESQAVEQRTFQILEVCRIFNVPPHKVYELTRATFSNIEHQAMEFVTECLAPWCVRWEQELSRKLLLESEKAALAVRFNLNGRLRGDTQSRYSAHAQGINAGFLTRNEARELENLPPVEGGDILLQPLNMAPIGSSTGNAAPADNQNAGRAILEDAAKRVLAKEAKALLRASKKLAGPELKTWADEFYTRHAQLVARVFAAPMKAAGLDNSDPAEYAARHCQASLQAIVSAIDLQDVADEWETIRAVEIVNELLKSNEG